MRKKLVLFISAMIFFAVNMKAETKNPFVKFTTVPDITQVSKDQVISMLKSAMQAQKIANATVLCNAESYQAAWGADLYAKVLAAPAGQFTLTKSVGGEKNWGIDLNGKAGLTGGTLAAGVPTISFGGVEIAKVGTNWCFNALTPFSLSQPGGDPDENKTISGSYQQMMQIPAGTGTLALTINNYNNNVNTNTNNNTAPAATGAGMMTYASETPQVIQQPYQPQQMIYPQQQYDMYPQDVYNVPRGRYVRNGDRSWTFYASANAAGTAVGGLVEDLLERWIWGNGHQSTWTNNGGGNGGGCLNCGGGPIHIGG